MSKLRGEERESVKLAKLHSSTTLTLEQLFRVSGKYGLNHRRSNYIDCRSNADTKDRMHSAFDSLFNGEAHDQTIDHIKSETRYALPHLLCLLFLLSFSEAYGRDKLQRCVLREPGKWEKCQCAQVDEKGLPTLRMPSAG